MPIKFPAAFFLIFLLSSVEAQKLQIPDGGFEEYDIDTTGNIGVPTFNGKYWRSAYYVQPKMPIDPRFPYDTIFPYEGNFSQLLNNSQSYYDSIYQTFPINWRPASLSILAAHRVAPDSDWFSIEVLMGTSLIDTVSFTQYISPGGIVGKTPYDMNFLPKFLAFPIEYQTSDTPTICKITILSSASKLPFTKFRSSTLFVDDIRFHDSIVSSRDIYDSKGVPLVVASPMNSLTRKSDRVTIIPNPASNQATINYTLESRSLVTVRVFDLQGRCVYQSSPANGVAGVNSMPIDLGGFSSGLYLAVVHANGQQLTAKFIKE